MGLLQLNQAMLLCGLKLVQLPNYQITQFTNYPIHPLALTAS
jgi:hypothetical protein